MVTPFFPSPPKLRVTPMPRELTLAMELRNRSTSGPFDMNIAIVYAQVMAISMPSGPLGMAPIIPWRLRHFALLDLSDHIPIHLGRKINSS